MAKIATIKAREILDSRSNPTIETTVVLDTQQSAVFSNPSGGITNEFESVEIRDKDENRYRGMGVIKAVKYINQIIGPGLIGVDPTLQEQIDTWMIKNDGTERKEVFGGNTLCSLSFAIARAGALASNMPLYQYVHLLYKKIGGKKNIEKIPTPVFNVINGGKHGAGNLDFQEFHIIPPSSKPFSVSLQIGSELYHMVKKVLIEKNAIHSVGDEGGYAPNLYTNLDALEVIIESVRKSSHTFGKDIFLGLDVAADHFFKKDHYKIKDRQESLSTEAFIKYLVDLNNQYHLLMLEDPLSSKDMPAWKKLTELLGDRIIIIADDLLSTNLNQLKKIYENNASTGVLIKPNQAGTLTETLRVIQFAQDHKFKVTISHRSGETCDDFMADLAVAVQSDYAKFGAPARGERVAKYNRLLKIEEELNNQVKQKTKDEIPDNTSHS